jgi:uncharacterized repeat protein (TIGR03837 family)
MRWDIFCKVIDNLGDIGVCWRLARQLAMEHGFIVRLWVDKPGTLSLLLPGFEPERARQAIAGVEIIRWDTPLDFADAAADVVIEAFACALPAEYLRAMTLRSPPPCWINLEYLSAESWVADCHGLASPHPTLPLVKFFFFPGFTPQTGGLIRERSLLEQQARFRRHAGRDKLLAALGLRADADTLLASLFCYDAAPVAALLSAWRETPLLCLVPPGKPLAAVQGCLGGDGPWQCGQARIVPIPFLPQTDYDRLLWACDLNFTRGEDSFTRAQWAGKPLVWHIYPQEGMAHWGKLNAFLERYTAAWPVDERALLLDFWRDWNAQGEHIGRLWPALRQHLPRLTRHAEDWRRQLANQEDLAAALVNFCRLKV